MRVAASIWLLVSVSVGRCEEPGPELNYFARSEVHMGVEFEVVLFAPEASTAEAALTKAFARIAELDKVLSDYDQASELSKLSESSHATLPVASDKFPAVKVSDDLWEVLRLSQQISERSGGAFDVTVGPLTKLWRRARRWKELPAEDLLTAARAAVGWQFLELDAPAKTARLKRPKMRLDLGGIAKGYAAEQAAQAVITCGIRQVLVRGSGDIVAADPPPGEAGWRVGIAPLNPDEPPQRFVHLANKAISTSGDARQVLVVDGRRYSHILDPRSGEPIKGRSGVTVIAPTGTLADGLATAASVLGPDQSLALIGRYTSVELLMVYEDDRGQQRIVESPGFRRLEQRTP